MRVLNIIDDISLMVNDSNVENVFQAINNLIFGFSQLSCLEQLYRKKVDTEDKDVNTKDGKNFSVMMQLNLIKKIKNAFD